MIGVREKEKVMRGRSWLMILLGLCLLTACRTEQESGEESLYSESQQDSKAEESEDPGMTSEPESSQKSEAAMHTFAVEEKQILPEIFENLLAAGYGESLQEWVQLAEEVDLSRYEWLSQIPNPGERCFAIEGYIMPGEYELPEKAEPREVLDILLRGWDERMTPELRGEIDASGYSLDEILNMASIVEWESAYGTDAYIKPNVASVILNRLRLGMKLQMDTSIYYLKEVKKSGAKDTKPYQDAYDTYKCAALPAGPICSPGAAAIDGVLHAPDTKYLFFVWKVSTGEYFFAETWEGHKENLKKAGIS